MTDRRRVPDATTCQRERERVQSYIATSRHDTDPMAAMIRVHRRRERERERASESKCGCLRGFDLDGRISDASWTSACCQARQRLLPIDHTVNLDISLPLLHSIRNVQTCRPTGYCPPYSGICNHRRTNKTLAGNALRTRLTLLLLRD